MLKQWITPYQPDPKEDGFGSLPHWFQQKDVWDLSVSLSYTVQANYLYLHLFDSVA